MERRDPWAPEMENNSICRALENQTIMNDKGGLFQRARAVPGSYMTFLRTIALQREDFLFKEYKGKRNMCKFKRFNYA